MIRHAFPRLFATMNHLVHLLDQSVDVLLSVSQVTALDIVHELPLVETASWIRQLEWPQKVARLLEVGTDGEDLVDQILRAHDAELAQVVLDQLIVGERDALLVDLAISTLVDELAHRLQVGVAVGDIWVDDCEHLLCGLRETDEDAVVDLEEAEELEDLARLGCNLVDTLDAENENELVLVGNVEGTVLLTQTGQSNLLTLGITILLYVGLGALEDNTALLFVCLSDQTC